METIGARVALYRNSRRWTQGYLASKTGLSQSQISNIENDHISPTWQTISKLAEQLEISALQLLTGGLQPGPQSDAAATPAERRLWERVIEAKEEIIRSKEETIRALQEAIATKAARP